MVDRVFELLSGQTKDYTIRICCFFTEHAALRNKSKDWLASIAIMCQSGATCLPADYCSVSKHYKNPTKRVGLVQCRHHELIEI